MSNTMVECQLPPDQEQRFVKLVQKARGSKDQWSEFLHFFENFLDDTEEYLMTLERLEHLERNNEKGIPFEEIVKELGLDMEEIRSSS